MGETIDRTPSNEPEPGCGRCIRTTRPAATDIPAMEAFLVSTGIVALAEMGDKTQLLSLVLAARFRKPWPIIAGMLAATLLNHAGAAWIGEFISRWMDPKVMTWLVAGAFIAMAYEKPWYACSIGGCMVLVVAAMFSVILWATQA